MNKYSEITTQELQSKASDLISNIESKRKKIITDLDEVKRKCDELKIIQEELAIRNATKT